MIRLGLIGYPVGQSLSPKIHTAALNACRLKGEYLLFPIQPDHPQGLIDLLSRVRSGEMTGLNVTIPHKQNVIPLIDELTTTAKAIGAVNVIYLRNQKLIGDNTDAAGFLADLNRLVINHQSKIENQKSALVLGAGGSARAVVYALMHDGWKVMIAARRIEQAQQIANSFTNHALRITDTISNIELSNISLIVNTTPIGMTPNIDQSPLPDDMTVQKDTFIYDLVYNPRATKLVKDARAKGLNATTGLGMLIEQAALAFELWTGLIPPRDALWTATEL